MSNISLALGKYIFYASFFLIWACAGACSMFEADEEGPSIEIRDPIESEKVLEDKHQSDEVSDLISKISKLSEPVISTVEIVNILTPSVVHIRTDKLESGFFNQLIPQTGVGSGLILDKDGRILTNNHVVMGADSLTVTLNDGRSYPADVIGGDVKTDIAVIKIKAAKIQPAELGNSSELKVGERVIAVGHALGLKGGPTVSQGVISALGRTIEVGRGVSMSELIQTDASINPGNSGGPLVNSQAEVVGINTAVINGSNGIGFAININDAKIIANHLIENGFVKRGYMGISPFELTDYIREELLVPVDMGVVIARVLEGYPAEKAGLKTEDVIVKLNDVEIQSVGALEKFLISHAPGEKVDVSFYRKGKLETADIKLGDPPR